MELRDAVTVLFPVLPNVLAECLRDLSLDLGTLLSLSIGLTCILTGSWLAGADRQQEQGEAEGAGEELLTYSSVLAVLVFQCMEMCLLYYWYDSVTQWLVAGFVLSATLSLFHCLQGFGRKDFPGYPADVGDCLLFSLCLGVCSIWVISRSYRHSWILQNLLEIAVCINRIRTFRLSNLRICTVVVFQLLTYGVFLAFLTPFLLKDKVSVMMKAFEASKDKLPGVFKVPRLIFPGLILDGSFTFVGVGDILLPGILAAHNYCFDLRSGSSETVYLKVAVLGYLLGHCGAALAAMTLKGGQPILLYIVPLQLVLTYAVAIYRGQLRQIFTGRV